MTDQKPPRGADGGPTGIEPISIIEEMQRSYLDYAMSVIVSRALPDVRDGLKPVHRRILYAAHESGYHWNRKYVKSARPVADVMGKYHPHGDASIYDALVRMAQDWSLRVPLIDGQGNFGSIDGDPPAAMRYTESRLTKVAHELLDDIDMDTVDFQETYDASGREPKVLPARFPNLLVNGSGGIAVGMATNIPPHNLSEVVNACIALIDNPAIELPELMQIIPGPDFPTGGIILGTVGIESAYATGRGSILMRGRVNIEQRANDRESIIITEVPYQVNKATMIEKMAELVREKRIEGISDIRDESDRQGYRVVIELKRDAVADVILNQLYRFTPLQTSFGANIVALNGGKPEVLTLLDMLRAFVSFREDVISRRTKFLLRKARDRAHVLVGLAIAVANIDEVIKLIRQAPDPQTAREQLMTRRWPAADVESLILLIDDPRHRINEDGTYNLSEEQARAILELRLARLTALGRDEIADELNTIGAEISDYLDILSSRVRIQTIVKDELASGARRVRHAAPHGAVVSRFRHGRRGPHPARGHGRDGEPYRLHQARAAVALPGAEPGRQGPLGHVDQGRGFRHAAVRGQHAHADPVLLLARHRLQGKGLAPAHRHAAGAGQGLINLLPLEAGDRITAIMPMPEDESTWGDLDVMFATTRGTVRRNKLSDFVQVNRNGKIAMKFDEEGDEILAVETCTENDDVLLTADSGQCIRFPVDRCPRL